MDPFKNMEDAFEPMFCDSVSIVGTRDGVSVKSGAIAVDVLDNGFDDSISDDGVQSTRRLFLVSIRRSDWLQSQPPMVGYSVAIVGNPIKLVVSAVNEDGKHYTLTARSVK